MTGPAESQDAKRPGLFVVMHTAVANFPRGARVTVDHLFHKNHPTRDAEWQRLQDLGAIRPEGDPEATALPETYSTIGAAPIIMAGAEHNLTPTLAARDDSIRETLSGAIGYPGARADSTAHRAPDGVVVAPESMATDAATVVPASGPATTVVRTEPRDDTDTSGQPATGRSRR